MTELKRMPGSEIKALPEANGRRRIGGYIVRFTSPDDTDLHGEWFSKNTDFGHDIKWSIVGKPVLIEHGLDPAFKSMPIGVFDLERIEDIGIYAEAWLHNRDDYKEMLRKRGQLNGKSWDDATLDRKSSFVMKAVDTFLSLKPGWSSGALPQTVEVDEQTRHINVWQTIEASTTISPAEPDGTDVIALRSVLDEVTPYLSIQPDAHEDGHSGDGQTTRKDATDVEPQPPANGESHNDEPAKDINAMPLSPEEIQAIAQQLAPMLVSALSSQGQAEQMPPAESVAPVMAAAVTDPEMKPEDVSKLMMETGKAYIEGKLKSQQSAVEAGRDYLKRTLPAIDNLPAAGNGKGNGHTPRVSIGENRKYAHLTAEEMALAVKVLEASYHPATRKRMTLNTLIEDGYITPEFVKTWQHKAAAVASNFKAQDDYLGRQSLSAVKSLHFLKADELNSSDITGQGLELTSIYYDNVMWERAREKTELFNMMVQRGLVVKDIPDGAKTANFKIDTSSPTVYTRHQARSVDSSGRPEVTARITPLGTDDVEVTPAEHVLATSATDILDEDSVIDIVRYLNQDIERTLGSEALENALINGDIETAANTNVNLIDGTPATGLQRPLYIAFDGFRKHALVTHSGQSNNEAAALSIDTYFDTVAEFDDNAIESRTNELLFIVDKDTHRASRKLPELLTPGVAMEGATIYVGKLPDIDGVAIYRSGFLVKSNTSGKISATAGNNTKGQIVCVFPYYWGYARKRAILIENDRDIMAGATVFVASIRHALVARSAKAATISYNITV